uniref:Phosphoinositide phospholipase C n=1 Tax=Plectus sambesii TaxID=2011161 RepID=A0A914VY07_9BILA
MVEAAIKSAEFCEKAKMGIQCESFTEEKLYQCIRILTRRMEINNIFDQIQKTRKASMNSINRGFTEKTPTITAEQFAQFLNEEQRDPRLNELQYPYYTVNNVQKLIGRYEPNAELAAKGGLSIDGFIRYLLGDDNAILAEEYLDQKQDEMNQPLTHYFINSSHNTYLTGHQLMGRSSVEIYRLVLLSGARSVELDCWDGPNNEPIITHGRTFVDSVLFKNVIHAIAESAFKTSPYPVVLSFENHCSPKQQDRMAQHCREIFGDMLLIDPLPDYPLEPKKPLPPPSLLERKIIIKNKKQAAVEENIGDSIDLTQPKSRSASFLVNNIQENYECFGSLAERLLSLPADAASINAACPLQTEALNTSTESANQAYQNTLFAPETVQMSSLVNYMRSMSGFTTFEDAEERAMHSEMYSLNENRALELVTKHPVAFVKHNKRQITRVYPKSSRIDSGNFMPQLFWSAGCQMSALNFQTLDLAMQLNLGFFELNGRSGYLLKPQCMRRMNIHFDPFADETIENVVPNTVTIRVISGQLLSTLSDKDRRLSTYVEVEMYGLPIDTVTHKFRTKTVRNNGINPVYWDENSSTFEFQKVVLPQLAILRLIVRDENGRTLGHRLLPVAALRAGYRHIPLRNPANQPLGLATLFVRIGVRHFIPDVHTDLVQALLDPFTAMQRQIEAVNALTDPIEYLTVLERRKEMLKNLTECEQNNVESFNQMNDSSSISDNVSASPWISADFESPVASRKESSISGIMIVPQPRLLPNGTSRLERYDLRLPTFESLLNDRKVHELRRTNTSHMKALSIKRQKEQDQMAKRHQRKFASKNGQKELSSASKTNGGFGFAAFLWRAKHMNRSGQYSPSKMSLSDSQSIEVRHDNEIKQLCSKYWREVLVLQQEFENTVKSTLSSLSDQAYKSALQTLDAIAEQEVSKLRKQSGARRKVTFQEDDEQDNIDISLQKQNEASELESSSDEQRKLIPAQKQRRIAEIEKNFLLLKPSIESYYAERLSELNRLYRPKIESGEIPVVITRL